MNKNLIKSIGAIMVGLVTIFAVTLSIDFMLERSGVMNYDFHNNSLLIQLMVTLYRLTISVLGCYITARLAPNRPMKHSLILGTIGLILTLLGSIAMWDAAPAWYSIALIVFTLPCAWLGGKLYVLSSATAV